VALTWLVLVVLAFAGAGGSLGGQGLFERLEAGDAPQVPGESRDGLELLSAARSDGPPIVLLVDGVDPARQQVAAILAEARPRLAALANVTAVNDPYAPAVSASPFVATDRRAFLVSVSTPGDLTPQARAATEDAVQQQLEALADRLRSGPQVTTTVGGIRQLVQEINDQVAEDLRIGETVALPMSMLVMVLVFGGLLAAGLPILGAIASIAGGLACLLGFSYLIELDASVPSVVSVMGLGLCIDYGLLLVSRFREEVRRLLPAVETEAPGTPGVPAATDRPTPAMLRHALERTMDTAGRTVLFSGITVAISLSGLLFFRATILRAVGAAGVSVVVVAVGVALTMVPALLALAGPRMVRPGVAHRVPLLRRVARRLGDVAPAEGVFSRLARSVQRRPLLVLLASVAALAAAAAPVADLQVISSGVSMLPVSSSQRQLMENLQARFPATTEAPIQVVSRADPAALTAWGATVSTIDGVRSVDPVTSLGAGPERISVLGVRTVADPRLADARQVVDRIRGARPDFPIWVSGETAAVRDFNADLRQRAPLAIGVVVLATFVLLFGMTGSVLVPLKALVMNTISLGASFGVLAWVFGEGNLEDLLRFTSNGGIDQTIPTLALAFAFGLSMDYEVFLLARIKETRDALISGRADGRLEATMTRLGLRPRRRHSRREPFGLNDIAVQYGLQRSGRIITSAALIVVIVFAGFAAGKLLIIKQLGVALAVAVAVDATLVRMLMVPAAMTLLGEWNWWAPGPLRRLHERFGFRDS
jgi:RND superfamily putative drug exporter